MRGLKAQRDDAAVRYCKKNGGDERVKEAFKAGCKWEKVASTKPLKEYIKELNEAVRYRMGTLEPWLSIQIRKTAGTMKMRDRLMAEMDEEDSTIRMGVGSTKQRTEKIDERMTLLKGYERELTIDFAALGLNFNATPKKITENTRQGGEEHDKLAALLNDINDV